ncbi:MAG TPA: hypothetical protein VE844_03000 [Gammaproteobacteria bacterium]|nr:hypothetical protein [Gammaproteobacteria bacterium]
MNLRVIPTSVHGVLDYVTGSALLATPELFRLKDVSPLRYWLPHTLVGDPASKRIVRQTIGVLITFKP